MAENVLYYGDNFDILRRYIPDESVDLIYLDPPFNSQASYNVLFKEPSGELSAAQLHAFSDTWHWDETAENSYKEVVETAPDRVRKMISALREFIGRNDMMAYMVMMTIRLVELRRVLKPTGSLYLHCDPTASHYLKIVLDTIFGPANFRNEIVWQRTGAHNDPHRYGRVTDSILFYTKSQTWAWNPQYTPYDHEYVQERYRYVDEATGRLYWRNTMTAAGPGPARIFRGELREPPSGTHWRFSQEEIDRVEREGRIYYSPSGMPYVKSFLDELSGRPTQNLWTDVPMSKSGKERLGYATQKPLALLERIISASSNPGDVVLDPFCGCGTAVVAAHKLSRRWIGIDVTHLAITVMKKRLEDSFGLKPGVDYQVIGEPVDLAGARALAAQDRYQFQWWALSLVGASPVGDDRKKGADRGVDGVIGFMEAGGRAKRIVVQVKSGHVQRDHIAKLKGDMERERADLGLFITLEPPTEPMRQEALGAGFYRSDLWQQDYPRIQICTIEQLLAGTMPKLPRWAAGGFAQAPKLQRREGVQKELMP
ncbi:MAG: restriction endonuclease [Chloroflexi bacterium]|nr:restriction endonuclease [Chloroflexota bacterium]